MTHAGQRTLAVLIAAPAAAAVFVSSAWLIADYAAARRAEGPDKRRLEALKVEAMKDEAHNPALAAELDRQAQLSLRRDARRESLGVLLAVAAAAFLTAAKWHASLRGDSAPSREAIAVARAAGNSSRRPRGRPPRLPPGNKTAGRAPEPCRHDAGKPGIDLSAVDAFIAEHGRTADAAIPILQAIQAHYGYLPDEALRRVCERTDVTPAQIAGVSSFYAQFRRSPAGRHTIKVCHGTACHVSGARQITDEIRRHLRIAPNTDTDPERMFTVDRVACLGCCSLAPVIMIDEHTVGRLTPAAACEAIDAFREEAAPA